MVVGRAVFGIAVAAIAVAAALLARTVAADDAAEAASIRDGVYTAPQAGRGAAVYPEPCGRCHGAKLDGAPDDPDMIPTPPIGGPKFLRNWDGRSLGALFEYTRTTMPALNPGSLSRQELVDVIAYMLFVSGAPAGPGELKPDPGRLGGILIEAAP